MAYISKITLPTGTTYDIKDAEARADIEALEGITGALVWLGISDSAINLTNKNVTIGGVAKEATTGSVVGYENKEYVWNGSAWQEFGDLTGLGTLAWVNSAEGSYTPAGTVSQPTFTGTEGTVNVSGSVSSSGVAISTGTGSVNYTPAGTIAAPSFTGTEGDVSVSGSATGTVTVGVGSGTANYTPGGTVSAPTISVATGGETTTVNSITSVGSLPELETSVANETLSINFSQGTLPTKGTDVSVKTTDASYSATAPSFTGTGVNLTGTFSNGSVSATGKFTPTGSVAAPVFSGTGVNLVGTISNTAVTASGNFTPSGEVSTPTFAGTADTITVQAPSA